MRYIDMHCDTVSALYRHPQSGNLAGNCLCIDADKLKRGQALMQFFACFVALTEHGGEAAGRPDEWSCRADASYEYVLHLLDYFHKENPGFKLCLSSEDCEQMSAAASDVHALLTVEEGGILNHEAKRLDALYDRGVRLMTLTWNFENCLGFPNSGDARCMGLGLKPFGKEIVEKMCAMGMMVDVSHLSDGGFWDVAEITKSMGRPFVASHSCARALCGHPRNLSDEMLKMLGECGGIVGVNFYGAFLNDSGVSDIEAIVRHIRYMVDKAGIEAVGFGSDFDGFGGGSEAADAAWMPKVFEALAAAGFNEAQIEKLAWKNALRMIKNSI